MSGSLILGVGGAIVGGAIGGPMGAKIGYALGSAVGGAIDNQGKSIKNEGPRVNDLSVQSNSYGEPIPKLWGTVKTVGNVIWATDIIEISKTESSSTGGKGGGPQVENKTYSYQANLAISICEAGTSDLIQIYANEILIYDASETNTGKVGDIKFNMRFYKGSESQQPDPLIQQYKGAYTPAYKDLSYVVFEDLELEKFGNQIPTFSFVITKSEENVESKIISEIAYSYGTQSDSNLLINDIAVNPVNKLIYVVRCTAEVPTASIKPLQIDIINPYTKQLIKQKSFAVNLYQATTLNIFNRQIRFNANGDLLLNCSLYFNEQTSTLEFPAVYNIIFLTVNKDTLTASRTTSTINSIPTTNLMSNSGSAHAVQVGDFQYHLVLQNTVNNNKNISLFTFNGSACVNVYSTTLNNYIDSNGNLIFDYDRKKNEIYFVTYNNNTRTTAYLNKLSNGIFYEQIATLYSGADAFGLSDIYFDSVSRSIFIGYFKNDYGYSKPINVIKIDADTFFQEEIEWGNIFGDGYPLKMFRVDENNRRFINKVKFTGVNAGLNYFTYLDMDNFAVENIAFNNSDIPNTNILIDSVNTAYHKDMDADFWIGDNNTTTNTSYTVVNSGKRVKYSKYNLSSLVNEICLQTGIDSTLIDSTNLASENVRGYVQTQNFTARGLIEPLSKAFSFDTVETNNKIYFKKRGNATYTTINETELNASIYTANKTNEDVTAIEITRTQELEMPKLLNLNYIDIDKNYSQNTQASKRTVDTTENITSVELSIVFNADEAKQIADKLLFGTWASRDSFSFSTNYDYINIEPSDLVKINNYLIRIIEKEESGGIIKFKGSSELPTIYTQTAKGATGEISSQVVENKASTNLYLLDLPIFTLNDNDFGLYAVVNKNYGTSWNGCSVYSSVDSVQYKNIDSITNESTIGNLLNSKLNNYVGGNTLDIGYSITVELVNGTLSTCTDAELENGKNLALIGNEIIQFKEANLIATNTYEIFGFLRGRFGTETEQNSHVIGEKFILLELNSGKIKRIERDNLAINTTKYFKAVTFGSYASDAQVIEFKNTCKAVKPYPVSNVKLNTIGSTSIALDWNYRVRALGLIKDYTDVDSDGDDVSFEIESIFKLSGNDVLINTYTTTLTTFTYTNAMFQSDLLRNGITSTTISPSTSKFKIYKVNKKFGRSDAVVIDYNSTNI